MPPKQRFNDDDDDSDSTDLDVDDTEDEDESSDSEDDTPPTVNAVDQSHDGQSIDNNPHDLAFNVEDDGRNVKTPPEGQQQRPTGAGGDGRPQAAAGGARGSKDDGNTAALTDNPHDEAYDITDGRHIVTPQGGRQVGAGVGDSSALQGNLGGSRILKNDAHDEASDVEGADETATPTKEGALAPAAARNVAPGGGQTMANMPHDEAFAVDGESVGSPSSSPANSPGQQQQQQQQHQHQHGAMHGGGDDSGSGTSSSGDDVDTDDEDQGGDGGASGGAPMMGQLEAESKAQADGAGLYNPADYTHLAKRLPREINDLFGLISAYAPQTLELPAKFRPFVPDFMPYVGEMDAFCKIPRPDGIPDNLGLVVVDEPSLTQSNPGVVKIGLSYQVKWSNQSTVVESLQDAHTKPGQIDSWVDQIKDQHKKKPLPTVNYSKPMPEIEELLQVWPQEFEDFLSTDIQFPPPTIDLDIEQYVRTMCILLDIPIYENIIESLHVLFTLFLEFRSNQHFQHQ